MAGNTIYIHVGTHKTGTSAIQDFFALNKKLLAKKGVLFPQKSRRNYFDRIDGRYVITSAQHKHYRALVTLCKKKKKDVLLSSETFSLIENLSEMKACLDDVKVKIICYLRRQDSLLQSVYNQYVKGGKIYKDISTESLYELDYVKYLDRFSTVFGKENLIIRVFEKQQFVNGDLLEDFLNLLGLEMTDEFSRLKKNPNPRLSAEMLEYMRYLNSIFKDPAKSKKFRQSVIAYSARQAAESTMSIFFNQSLLSLKQRQSIFNDYDQSNRLVATEYLGRHDGRLFYDSTPEASGSEETFSGLTDDQVLEVTRFLCCNRKMKKMLAKVVQDDDQKDDLYSANARERIRQAIRILESK